MIRSLLLILPVLFPGSPQPPGSGAATPLGPAAPAATAPKRVVLDAADPAWRAVAVQLGRIAAAERAKDMDELRAVYAPDFVSVQANGERWDLERVLAFQASSLQQVVATICLNGTPVRIELEGDTAYVTVLWDWTRMQRMAGKVRRVQTSSLYEETWVRTPAAWRRRRVENVRSGTALVDDKRVDVRRPYDPEAPAYDPLDARVRRPLADVLFATFQERGPEAGLEQFRSLRGAPEYYVSEASLNALGYRLLGEKKAAEAVAVLKLNTELYPRSGNAFDSLGEAYLAAGNAKQAARSYRRSLALDPKNENARAALRKLGQ